MPHQLARVPLELSDAALDRAMQGPAGSPHAVRAAILRDVPPEGRAAVVADARFSSGHEGGYGMHDLMVAAAAYRRDLPLAGVQAQRLDPRTCDDCAELL